MVDCLTHEQCDEIIQWSKEKEFSRAVVLCKGGVRPDDIRTNTTVGLNKVHDKIAHEAINKAVMRWGDRIKEDYPEVHRTAVLPGHTWGLDTWKEPIGLLKYEAGQKYDWHVDQSFRRTGPTKTQSDKRIVSAVVYLNDDFEGGETQMPEKIWKPKKGKALIFPSHWTFPHQARPVTKGTKYALVTWFHAYESKQ